ncbi:hypothetical protein [Halostella litorea]|uniref:hypothetical protein n=1 Tax=Halostella litorea TaxID=2528831 RepID=UPI00109230E0|nr:hypothetical protein [Halostella litorea]
MTAEFRVDVETALRGAQVDTGEMVHCLGCTAQLFEGRPVTVIARTRTGGWDVEAVFCAQCAPDELAGVERRDSEGIALAEAELATVTRRQQVWLSLVLVDVLGWIEPRR